jgi:hypothetical protein
MKPSGAKDLCDHGRLILAHGEMTGHAHIVTLANDTDLVSSAEYFEEPNGRRVLFALRPCVLSHQEHGLIQLDPTNPQQVRQGDVLLNPIGIGAWEVIQQREYTPSEIKTVTD